jgi:hypothetical protein
VKKIAKHFFQDISHKSNSSVNLNVDITVQVDVAPATTGAYLPSHIEHGLTSGVLQPSRIATRPSVPDQAVVVLPRRSAKNSVLQKQVIEVKI